MRTNVVICGALLAALSAPAQAQQSIEQAMLDFVNDPATTKADLESAMAKGWRSGPGGRDASTGWSVEYNAQSGVGGTLVPGAGTWVIARAVSNVLAHRAGPDGVFGRGRDDRFDTLKELHDVIGVGGECMEGIEIHVTQLGGVVGSTMLAVANTASRDELTGVFGSSDAASEVILYREGGPDLRINSADDTFVAYSRIFGRFDTRDHLDIAYPAHSVDAVPGIGPARLQALHDYALLTGIDPQQPAPVTTTQTIDDLSALSPELQAAIGDLMVSNPFDTSNTNAIRFTSVTVTSIAGVPVSYEVELFQWIDPEGGMSYRIVYVLDANLNVIGEDVYV